MNEAIDTVVDLVEEHPIALVVVLLLGALAWMTRQLAAERRRSTVLVAKLFALRESGTELDEDTTQVMERRRRARE